MNRLKDLVKGLESIIRQLRTEGEFQNKFLNIVKLAKTPFVQMMLSNFNVDPNVLDTVFNGLLHDKQVYEIIETVANIFECFSVNRFIGVETEKELEDLAVKLNEKKLFYAGIYFGNEGNDNNKEFSYKLRMDVDNTPITLENRNRFWFPGPNGNFELNMRYHRGFIQIQNIIDQALIKTVVEVENKILEEEWYRTTSTTTTTEATKESTDDEGDIDDSDDSSPSSSPSTEIEEDTTVGNDDASEVTQKVSQNEESTSQNSTEKSKVDATTEKNADKGAETTTQTTLKTETKNESTTAANEKQSDTLDTIESSDLSDVQLVRKKRQFDFIDELFGPSHKEEAKFKPISVDDMLTFTKQFPYPKYRRDDFLTGIYLAQCIQLVFFFALIVQVSNAVRNRIWMRESGNSTVSNAFTTKQSTTLKFSFYYST